MTDQLPDTARAAGAGQSTVKGVLGVSYHSFRRAIDLTIEPWLTP